MSLGRQVSLREENIEERQNEKSNKYAHFTSDIADYNCKVEVFEVSSKGFLTSRNHTTLATLHRFINPNIKLSLFKKNISALSLTASYHISTARLNLFSWNRLFLLPPIKKCINSSELRCRSVNSTEVISII